MPSSSSPSSLRAPGAWLAIATVVVMTLVLRPGATSVGPLLQEVLTDLGQGPTWGGVLTAMPSVCFAVFGGLAVGFASRVGINHALWIAAAMISVGLLTRAFIGDATIFLLFSVLAFAGMAVGNVLVPAFIKRHFPDRTATMMALYGTLLAVGATLASALTVPMALRLSGGWQASLAVWGVVAAVAVVPTLALALRDGGERIVGRLGGRGPSLWRSPRAIALGLFFGIQSMQFYAQIGWAAQMFRDGGVDAETAGLLVSIIAGFGILTGLFMPAVVQAVRDLRWIVVAMGVVLVAGYLGMLIAPTTAPWVWAVFLGLFSASFPMALALLTARTRDPSITVRLSGFAQSIGYGLAALGPFVVGFLRATTGGWTVPLWVLIATSVPLVIVGIIACAPGYVDDDLDAATG